jgi:hypothetical protein
MLKFVLFFLALLPSFNAHGIVKQDLSKALTYENIITAPQSKNYNFNNSNSNSDLNTPSSIAPQVKKIDLTNKYSDRITIAKNDIVEITLDQKTGYSWAISTSSDNLKLISNTSKESSRILQYVIDSSDNGNIYFIYFDHLDSQNKVQTNKQITISVSK